MADLTPEQKLFVVQHLATDFTPKEVVDLLQERFKVKASLQQLEIYNPENAEGERLSGNLRDEFYRVRSKWRNERASLPLHNANFRDRKLQQLLDDPERGRSIKVVLPVLEFLEKRDGGMFRNRSNAATPEEVADYVGEIVADIRAGVVSVIPDPETQKRALDEIQNRLANRGKQGGTERDDATAGRPPA